MANIVIVRVCSTLLKISSFKTEVLCFRLSIYNKQKQSVSVSKSCYKNFAGETYNDFHVFLHFCQELIDLENDNVMIKN